MPRSARGWKRPPRAWQKLGRFRALGFRVLGFRVVGFRVLGFRVLGFRILLFRVVGFRGWYKGLKGTLLNPTYGSLKMVRIEGLHV